MNQELTNQNMASLNSFMVEKQKEILALAQKHTEAIVKTEVALMDFEIFLASHIPRDESERLTTYSRKMREDSWNDLVKRNNSNHEKMMQELENY